MFKKKKIKHSFLHCQAKKLDFYVQKGAGKSEKTHTHTYINIYLVELEIAFAIRTDSGNELVHSWCT